MKLTGNTILITGGGSGIGRGFAEAFHALHNQVVIAGRRTDELRRVAEANPGMKFATLDQADASDTVRFAAHLLSEYHRSTCW